MQTQKMSLANIQGKLRRTEMKNIMAGSGNFYHCCIGRDCIICYNYKPACGSHATSSM